MHCCIIPDVFEIPDREGDKSRPWFAALAISAIIVGATVALVTVNEQLGGESQVTTNL